MTPSIYVTRDIDSPADWLFELLTQPALHPDIDGSGMLRSAIDEAPLREVGDVFRMRMCNDELGEYVVENRVVEYEPVRRVAWEPVLASVSKPEFAGGIGVPARNRWGWSLDPLPVGGTRVTEFFDCSSSPEWLRKATRNGERWRAAIENSLDNLARLAAASLVAQESRSKKSSERRRSRAAASGS